MDIEDVVKLCLWNWRKDPEIPNPSVDFYRTFQNLRVAKQIAFFFLARFRFLKTLYRSKLLLRAMEGEGAGAAG